MSNEFIGLIGLILVLLLMFSRLPLGLAFVFVGAIGTMLVRGLASGLDLFYTTPYHWATEYSFTCLPMFILMGLLVAEMGIAQDLYESAHRWLGAVPGGLAMTTLMVTALFSAVSGSSVAAASTISVVCYPEMKRLNYDPGLATGVIASGATMDIMIPPSIPMIIFGMLSTASIGDMFIAGFGAGFIEFVLFCLLIFIMIKRKPSLAPACADKFSFIAKLKGSSKILPLVIIFLSVFGGMYGGIFTPTEAGAFGVASSIVVCGAMRRLRWQGLLDAAFKTVLLTGQIMLLVIGAIMFNKFMALSGLAGVVATWVVHLGVSPPIFMVVVALLYLGLGAVMDELSMMLLTLPFFLPTVNALDINIIHFGILIILAWQIGGLAPPVGLIVFVTKSAIKDVSLWVIYRGCLPFIGVLAIVEALTIFEPKIAMFPLFLVKFVK